MPGTHKIDVTDPMQVAMHLATITTTMQSMQRDQGVQAEASRIAIAALDAKIGTVADAVHGFAQVRYDTAAHAESINRLWQADKDKRALVEVARDSSRRILWIGTGAGAVIMLLVLTLVYLYQTDKSNTKEDQRSLERRVDTLDERADRIEIYLAGDRAAPYKR